MTSSAPPPHAQGSIRFEVTDGGDAVVLTGEIDAAAVEEFERIHGGKDFPQDGRRRLVVLVDAEAATFLNSVGTGLLIRLTDPARRAGLRPKLRRPSRPVTQILRVTGLDQMFDRID
jgi:anti-anti-sigma factor